MGYQKPKPKPKPKPKELIKWPDNRINCDKAGCDNVATTILHWKGFTKQPWLMCDGCAKSALSVVHV